MPDCRYVRVPEGVHEGVGCDRSGACPIVGIRYSLRGHDYDLCAAEFAKLSETEQARFDKVGPPGYYMRRTLHGEPSAPPVHIRRELPRPGRA